MQRSCCDRLTQGKARCAQLAFVDGRCNGQRRCGESAHPSQSGSLPFLCQQVLSSLWEEAVIKGTMIDTADVDRAVDDLIERACRSSTLPTCFEPLVAVRSAGCVQSFCRGQPVSEEMLMNLTLTGLCEDLHSVR